MEAAPAPPPAYALVELGATDDVLPQVHTLSSSAVFHAVERLAGEDVVADLTSAAATRPHLASTYLWMLGLSRYEATEAEEAAVRSALGPDAEALLAPVEEHESEQTTYAMFPVSKGVLVFKS
jgi:hypothetical protein